jgi:hypothetical protein
MSTYIVLENFEHNHFSLSVRRLAALNWNTKIEDGVEMYSDTYWERNGLAPKWFRKIYEGSRCQADHVYHLRKASYEAAGIKNSGVGRAEVWKDVCSKNTTETRIDKHQKFQYN